MHEYALVDALVRRAGSEAAAHGARAVHRVKVTLGDYCGVEPELFRSAFELVRAGTVCAGAELELVRKAARFACPRCGGSRRRGGGAMLPPLRNAGPARAGRRRAHARVDRAGGALMCTTCGCGDPALVPVELHERILAENDRTASHNRAHFRASGILALNVMGSPGSGKTALLEATARLLPGLRLGAVSADLATDLDAQRLWRPASRPAPITTGAACHLDAEIVHRALHGAPWETLDVFFIENVGNLVCPAIYDLGQAANVVALSVTEGEDKPQKYPVMFHRADLVVVTKCDLLPYLDFDLARLEAGLARVTPSPKVLKVSARTGEGLEGWRDFLLARHAAVVGARALDHGRGHPHGPAAGIASHHDHDHPARSPEQLPRRG